MVQDIPSEAEAKIQDDPDENEQATFERWAKTQGLRLDEQTTALGGYYWPDTRTAWDAWQAARSAKAY